MANSRFKRVQTGDEVLNRIQDNINTGTNETSQIGSGTLLSGISLSGTTEVPHNLGRAAQGGFGVLQSAGGRIEVRPSSDPTRFVSVVVTGGGMTASLWVF